MSTPAENQENQPPEGPKLENPGVASEANTASISTAPDAPEEQDAQAAAAQKRRQGEIEFLKWEELIEQLKVLDPESKTQPVPNYWQSYMTFIDIKLDGTPENNKFVVPKVIETSGSNNAVVFKELLDNVRFFTKLGSQHNLMASASETGAYDISQKGIFFKAGTNPDTKEKAPFTEAEAKGIALLAMHNRDLLPPGSLKITGNPQQRAMIFVEIEKLNQLLPENARMIVSNKNEIDMNLVATLSQTPAAPSAPEGKPSETPESRGAFKTPTEARNFTPEEIAAAQDNFSGKTPAGTPPTATENTTDNAVAIEEVADDEAESGLKNGKDGPSIAEQQLQKMQERINSFSRQEILDHAKKIGVTETRHHVYSEKIRIEDAPPRAFTEVLFTAPKKGERQIISIGKTDFYEGYQSDEITVKRQPKDKLDAAFPAAASGESTSVSTSAPAAPVPKGDEPRLTA